MSGCGGKGFVARSGFAANARLGHSTNNPTDVKCEWKELTGHPCATGWKTIRTILEHVAPRITKRRSSFGISSGEGSEGETLSKRVKSMGLERHRDNS